MGIYIDDGIVMFTTPELKYNWRFMDKFGNGPKFTAKTLRKLKLKRLKGEDSEIFEDNILYIYLYNNELDISYISYRHKNEQLRIGGLNFKVKSLIEAEHIVNSFIKGNRLLLGEIYQK